MTALPRELLESPLPGLGRPLSQAEATTIHKYLELLVKWQRSQRLVGSIEHAWLIENVVLDSLAFLGGLPADARHIVDIGSGAGLPGIPLAIVLRGAAFTLIEARRRRVSFLSTAIRELDLTNAEVLDARVETLEPTHGGRFDAAVMRCAGRPEAILSPALVLLRPGGVAIVAAGRRTTVESTVESGETQTISVAGHERLLRRFVKP